MKKPINNAVAVNGHDQLTLSRRPIAAAIRASAIGLSLACMPTHAAHIIVTANTDDNNLCTLREAIVSVNAAQLTGGCGNANGESFGTNDFITFANTGEIQLSAGELTLSNSVDVDASTVGGVTINAMQNSRVMNISGGQIVRLSQLTLTGGVLTEAYSNGGGLLVSGSGVAVNIVDSQLSNNRAFGGGGLADAGGNTITLINSNVSNNAVEGFGGGLSVGDNSLMTLSDSAVTNNTSNGSAGGVGVVDGDLVIMNSQVSGNSAAVFGGGVFAASGSTSLISSTVSDNTAVAGGGILHVAGTYSDDEVDLSQQSLSLTNSTVSGNVAVQGVIGGIGSVANTSLTHSTVANNTASSTASGIYAGTSLTVINSILGDGVGSVDCDLGPDGVITVDAQSIVEAGDCGQTRDGDAGLLPLADNGGPTPTHALKPNSPAIDTANNATCPTTDQRGVDRDSQCDVGAFEFIEPDGGFFVIPLKNGKTVVIPE